MCDIKENQTKCKDLTAGMNYFLFHLRMYVGTLIALQEIDLTGGSFSTINNCLVMSNLISSRCLIDFFLPDPKSVKKDMIYTDYVKNFSFKIEEAEKKKLIGLKQSVGRTIAHVSSAEKHLIISLLPWPVKEVSNILIPVLVNFLTELPVDHLAENRKNICFDEIKQVIPAYLSNTTHTST